MNIREVGEAYFSIPSFLLLNNFPVREFLLWPISERWVRQKQGPDRLSDLPGSLHRLAGQLAEPELQARDLCPTPGPGLAGSLGSQCVCCIATDYTHVAFHERWVVLFGA